jgi:hypothetical protein
MVLMEDWGLIGPQNEYMLVRIDYPNPDSVDRKLFQFQIPPGVPVHHPAPMPPPRRKPLTRQEKVWLAQQKDLNICLSHLSQLREALRRYANDHQGQWPAALAPAVDPYIKDRTVLRCPRDHASDETSYVYHRLTGSEATAALAQMNDSSPRPGVPPPDQLHVLLDCPHHPGLIWHIDARGSTFGNHDSHN